MPRRTFSEMEQSLIDIAGELFDRRGFNQSSLQDVADVLGKDRTALYHYFTNREEILAAGIGQVTLRRNRILRKFRSVKGEPPERLEWLVRGLGQLISENPVWIRVASRDDLALPRRVRDLEYGSRRAYFEVLVDVLREGVEKGYFRLLDERATALTIVSSLAGLRGHYSAEAGIDPEVATRLTVDILLHGVLDSGQKPGSAMGRGLRLIRDGFMRVEREIG